MVKFISSGLFACLLVGSLQAQQNTVAAGGEASGSGGTMSFSVGQVVYSANANSDGSVYQGVQQPYEIFIATGLAEANVQLEVTAFPNPTPQNLTLTIGEGNANDLEYQVYDLSGKLLLQQRIEKDVTIVTLDHLASATYFIKVTNDQQVVKTFKIVKN